MHTQQLFVSLHPASLCVVGIECVGDQKMWTADSVQQTAIQMPVYQHTSWQH